MTRMINGWTGTEMFVADDRVDEYLAAGCVLAAKPVTKKAEPVKVESKTEEKPKKAPVKKVTAKKTTAKK